VPAPQLGSKLDKSSRQHSLSGRFRPRSSGSFGHPCPPSIWDLLCKDVQYGAARAVCQSKYPERNKPEFNLCWNWVVHNMCHHHASDCRLPSAKPLFVLVVPFAGPAVAETVFPSQVMNCRTAPLPSASAIASLG
jgi:hypothetical protein